MPAGIMRHQAISGDTTTNFQTIHGWHFTETTALTGAKLEFRLGNASGAVVFTITLAPNETAWENYGGTALHINSPLHVEVVSGSIQGAVMGG